MKEILLKKYSSCDPIRSDSHMLQENEWIYGKVSTKVYTAFLFMGHAFWKENIQEQVKLLESIVLNCCVTATTADLRRIGFKMREWRFGELSSQISQQGRGHVRHSTTPPPLSPTLISSSNLSLGLNMILSSLVLWHWKQQNLDTCCSLLITAFMGSEKRAPQFRVQSFKMLFLVGLSSFTFSKLLWIILISRSNCRRAQSRG